MLQRLYIKNFTLIDQLDIAFEGGFSVFTGENEAGKLSEGAMIGISPVLNKKMSDTFKNIAERENIPYQLEVMGAKTGTDADVIGVSHSGVKTGLISIPIRNMHTDAEVVDINDILSVCDILERYILSGGIMDDRTA